MLVHYVEFVYPGVIVSESSVRRIDNRDPSKVELPDGAFGWRFYDRIEIEQDGELLVGKPKNHSAWTYYGEVWNREQAILAFGGDSTLARNMEYNNIDRVVHTRYGQCIPLRESDQVLTAVERG